MDTNVCMQDVVVPVTGVDNGKFVAAQHSRRGGERVRTVKGVHWYSGCTPDCLVKELNKLQPKELPAKLYTFSYVQIVTEEEEIVSHFGHHPSHNFLPLRCKDVTAARYGPRCLHSGISDCI